VKTDALPSPTPPTDAAELQELLLVERARREKAEAELARLHALTQVALLNPNPSMRLSAAGQLLYTNHAAEPLLPELQSTGPSRLRPQLLHAATQALRTGEVGRREVVANGQHFVLHAVPLLEEQTALLYLTDVTDQRQAEQRDNEQREFYETILAHLPAVVTVLDPDQRYRYINPYAEPDPAQRRARLGKSFADHAAAQGLPDTLVVRRRRLFERAVNSRGPVSWEERWPGPDGDIHLYWLCYYQPVFGADGGLREVLCYGFDITVRRQAEARSRQSEAERDAQQAFTNLVLDLNPNLIWVRDAQARTVFENAEMRRQRQHIANVGKAPSMEAAMSKEEIQQAILADQ
jgi:PAS domain-containing protein